MSKDNDDDLKITQELFDFLQGNIPAEYTLKKSHVPKLTADQAWTVIWYLANLYWQVTDRVERCDICGSLYHSEQKGHCFDFGKAPYNFCNECMGTDAFSKKERSRLNPERKIKL